LKLPRGPSGHELTKLLRRHGNEITRPSGTHLRLISSVQGDSHDITVSADKELRVGTLSSVLKDVSAYLRIARNELEQELFGK